MPDRPEKSVVCVERVASYENAGELAAAVDEIFRPFGGVSHILGGRKRVLLKPNVLRAASPADAVTTHPEVVRAVARAFLDAGAEVMVGDAPGGDPGPALPVFQKSGIEAVCTDLGIKLVNFQKEGVKEITLSGCVVPKVTVARPVVEADLVVNLPKLKTHELTQYTCALKNVYGYIPGFLKGKLHVKAPSAREMAKIFCALHEAVPTAFTLVDGILAMEGPGPSAGDPMQAGLMFGGTDPVAVDTAAVTAMGYQPEKMVVLQEAVRRGLGCGDPEQIELVGGTFDALPVPGFKLPHTSWIMRVLPAVMVSWITTIFNVFFWARPHVIPSACRKCHLCVRSCPTGAMQAELGQVPHLADARACISCLCCQEMCPAKAIEVRKSMLVTRIFQSEEKRMAATEENAGKDR